VHVCMCACVCVCVFAHTQDACMHMHVHILYVRMYMLNNACFLSRSFQVKLIDH